MNPPSRWRRHAAKVIGAVIAANPDATEPELRKLISAEYPYGERESHPYKMWLKEVNQTMLLRFRGNEGVMKHGRAQRIVPTLDTTLGLFD